MQRLFALFKFVVRYGFSEFNDTGKRIHARGVFSVADIHNIFQVWQFIGFDLSRRAVVESGDNLTCRVIKIRIPVLLDKDQRRRVRLIHDIFEFAGLIIRIHRYQDRTDHSECELRIDPFRNVCCPNRYVVPFFHAYRHKSFGYIFTRVEKLVVILL